MMELTEIYGDKSLYSSPDMFSPPAERRGNAIRFELTVGCQYGKCTFCEGYKGIPFREKPLEEYKGHVDAVFQGLERPHQSGLTKIFIGGADALAVETEKLSKALTYTRNQFFRFTFIEKRIHEPKRISLYGSTRSISAKSLKELQELHYGPARLDLIYWGIESGSAEVLRYINKGCTPDQIVTAAQKAWDSALQLSVMVMPGLGGAKYSDVHTTATAKILSKARPRYITFMGVNPPPGSLYARKMAKEMSEGTNRPLTDGELLEQTMEIIRQMKIRRPVKIGCFWSDVDQVGYNPMAFGSVDIAGYIDGEKEKLAFVEETLRICRFMSKYNEALRSHRLHELDPAEVELNLGVKSLVRQASARQIRLG